MNLHPIIIALALMLYASTATTQINAILSGQVSSQAQPLEFAELLLLSDSSELIAHTTVTNGFFRFEPVAYGNYQLRTLALGYLDDQRTVILNANQEISIQLEPDEAFLLDEVIVKEKRERFTNEGGNLRMNVAQTALAASNNTLDLLSKLPGAILSSDRESLTIIGQGSPLIYLNNQQISLSEFSAIPVSDIQDVELINNPSARYEANGRIVLLVRLKRQRAEGYRIELANNLARKQGWNNNLTANANWNKDKWTGKLNLGYQQQQPWEQVESEFSLLDQFFASAYQATVFGNRNVYIIGGGLAYQNNANSSLSLRFNTHIRDGQGDATTFSSLQQDTQQSEFVTATDQDDHRHNINLNLNYNRDWKKSSLFLGGQYLNYGKGLDADIANSTNGSTFVPEQIRNQLFKVNLSAFRLDLEHRFTDQFKGELGFNVAYTASPTTQDITDLTQEPASFTNSQFTLDEKITAAYSQLSGSLRKLNWTIGLRAEQADVEGGLVGENDLRIDRNQFFLFPNLSLNQPLDSNSNLTFNYRRSIQRPNFSNLSQVAFYVNPFTIIQENTGLLSSLQDDYALVYQWQQSSLRLSCVHNRNPNFFSTFYDETQELYVLSRRNFDRSTTFALSLTLPFSRKAWSSLNGISLFSSNISDADEITQPASPYLYAYTQQEVDLSEKMSITLRAWGMTKRREGIFERNAIITTDFVATYQPSEPLVISLSFIDMFNGFYFQDIATIQAVQSLQRFNIDSRQVALSIRYSLGKSKADFQTREAFEASNRVR